MSVVVFDGLMLSRFVEDGEDFNACVDKRFAALDQDGDGVLSRSELKKGFEGVGMLAGSDAVGDEAGDVYGNALFLDKFDADGNGGVDAAAFRAVMKEVLLALARGIGESPVHIATENDSLLMKVVEHEAAIVGG